MAAQWSKEAEQQLERLWRADTPVPVICDVLGRTKNEVVGKRLRMDLPPRRGGGAGNGRAPKTAVPAWVPEGLRAEYHQRAKKGGEQAAAKWARRVKAILHTDSTAVADTSEAPARVEPIQQKPQATAAFKTPKGWREGWAPKGGGPAALPLPPKPAQASVEPLRGSLAALSLTTDTCCWPIGSPGEADFQFCCAPPEADGKPYCARHAAGAYAGRARAEIII